MRRFVLGVAIGTGLAMGAVVGGAAAALRKLDA
jgi:hypothetical protein